MIATKILLIFFSSIFFMKSIEDNAINNKILYGLLGLVLLVLLIFIVTK